MSMPFSRYQTIRNRLIELYQMLQWGTFDTWIAPKTFMSTQELKNRTHNYKPGYANDHYFYETTQLRKMTACRLVDILPNLESLSDLGFKNANHAVTSLYEGIQEYIALWCEMMRNAPEFYGPPLTELRQLENLALFIFPYYKKIKPFITDKTLRDQVRQDQALNQQGLLGLAMLFRFHSPLGKNGQEEISFVSHLDDFVGGLPGNFAFDMNNQVVELNAPPVPSSFQPNTPFNLPMDSLRAQEVPISTEGLGEWVFKG